MKTISNVSKYSQLNGRYTFLSRWPTSMSAENSSIIWTQSQRLDSPLIASTSTSFYPANQHGQKYWGVIHLSENSDRSLLQVKDYSGYTIPILSKSLWGRGLKGLYLRAPEKQMELYVKRAFMRVIEWPNSRPEFAGSFVTIFVKVLFNSPTANLTISFPSSFDLSLSPLLHCETQSLKYTMYLT